MIEIIRLNWHVSTCESGPIEAGGKLNRSVESLIAKNNVKRVVSNNGRVPISVSINF